MTLPWYHVTEIVISGSVIVLSKSTSDMLDTLIEYGKH